MSRTVRFLICLLLMLGSWPSASWGQEPVLDEANAFITRWTGEAGKPIQVPLYGNYAYSWEKADGTVIKADVADVANEGLLELPVAEAGKYVLKAGPTGVKRIEFGIRSGNYYDGSRGTPGALLQVVQWGSVQWESLAGAFYGCEKMNIAEGAGKPDLSGVTSMESAFDACISFNSPIGDWDVSSVTDMRYLFDRCNAFNQPLEKWDVSQVTDMMGMFHNCSAFNQPLEGWDVSKVTKMYGMFDGCSAFNQPLENWDVSKVTDMLGMFASCSAFNQPLEKWDVSQVTHMGAMFYKCIAFNQPLEKWDVSNVTSMLYMFRGCSAFNQPLGVWTLSALERCTNCDEDLGISKCGLSVENYSATLEAWAGKIDQLQNMVRVNAKGLIYNAAGKAARQVLIDEKQWVFEGDVELLPIEPVEPTSAFTTRWQGKAGEVIQVPLYGQYAYRWEKADGTEVASGEVRMFDGLLDLPVAEDGEYVLKAGPAGVRQLEFGDKEESDYYTVRSRGTPGALRQIEQWGSVAWENFYMAFSNCENMTVADGAGWPDLSRVTSTDYAFYHCKKFNAPMGDCDVSKVTNMGEMFYDCSVFNQPLGKWDVSKVTQMGKMFYGCKSFNQPLEKWDVSKVTNMRWMFEGCSAFNQPLEKWDVSKVTNMCWMFEGCSAFNQPLGGWTLSALKYNQDGPHDLGLLLSGLSVENYSATLAGWAAKKDQLKTRIRVDGWGLYFDERGKAARQELIDEKGWVFEGDSEATVSTPGVEIVDAPSQLHVGETYTFKARVEPAEASQEVKWSVKEGDEWGTFSGNVLTVKKTGRILVTATSVAVSTSRRSVEVQVLDPISLTGITVSPATAQLYVNCTQQLMVGYVPENATNKSVTWSSSDENVATVSAEGLVTSKKIGTATMTATADDGGHKASCTVTVLPVLLTGITVSPATAQLKVYGTQQLTVSYMPVNTTNRSVTWSSSDEGVALVDAKGVVTAKKAGTATITATSVDGGHRGTCTVTVVADDKPSGVESALLSGVAVSPNPFGENLTVYGAEGVVCYSLVSATGAEVLRGRHDGGDALTLSTPHLPAGIYWLRLSAEDGDRVLQVVRL